MKHLDLFSGIGGFALAARWVGWKTVGFCEIDPYCQKVLAKHWPGVPIYDDIKEVTAERLRADGIVGAETGEAESGGNSLVITGGFPCQDIIYAGKGAGIEGERSGLWTELARIIGEVRPRYAVLENVAALLSRGLDRVAGDLAEIGYDCEWHCIPASSIGAPHRRDRIWIIAYPQHPDADNPERGRRTKRKQSRDGKPALHGAKGNVADTDQPRLEGWLRKGLQECTGERAAGAGDTWQDGDTFAEYWPEADFWITQSGMGLLAHGLSAGLARPGWLAEPGIGRVANGVPDRIHKLRGLGNAVVPQIPYILFEAINEIERSVC